MIGTDHESVLVRHQDVLLEFIVDAVASLGCFQVDECHFGILADSLPEDIALIVAQVDAVNVLTRVFALHECVLSLGGNDAEKS